MQRFWYKNVFYVIHLADYDFFTSLCRIVEKELYFGGRVYLIRVIRSGKPNMTTVLLFETIYNRVNCYLFYHLGAKN